MGITVSHEVPIEVLSQLGYSAGKGQQRERDIDRRNALVLALRRMNDAERARQEGLAYNREQSGLNREHDLEMFDRRTGAASDLYGQQQGGRMDLAGFQADLEGEMYDRRTADAFDAQRMQQQGAMDLQGLRNQGYVDRAQKQYSAAQQREIAKIQAGHDWLDKQVALGTWTPEQADDAHMQLEEQRHGITPREPIGADSPYPVGMDIGDTWLHNTGAIMTRDSKGDVKMLNSPPKPNDSDFTFPTVSKLWTDTYSAMASTLTGMEGETVDVEEVDKAVYRIMDFYQRMTAVGPPAPGEMSSPAAAAMSAIPVPTPELEPYWDRLDAVSQQEAIAYMAAATSEADRKKRAATLAKVARRAMK